MSVPSCAFRACSLPLLVIAYTLLLPPRPPAPPSTALGPGPDSASAVVPTPAAVSAPPPPGCTPAGTATRGGWLCQRRRARDGGHPSWTRGRGRTRGGACRREMTAPEESRQIVVDGVYVVVAATDERERFESLERDDVGQEHGLRERVRRTGRPAQLLLPQQLEVLGDALRRNLGILAPTEEVRPASPAAVVQVAPPRPCASAAVWANRMPAHPAARRHRLLRISPDDLSTRFIPRIVENADRCGERLTLRNRGRQVQSVVFPLMDCRSLYPCGFRIAN